MGSVDMTIDVICKWIQSELKAEVKMRNAEMLPEMTKALAELISARAAAEAILR